MASLPRIRDELSGEWAPTFALAAPVMLGQVGLMSMVIVDTLFIGRLGEAALGAFSVSHALSALAMLVGLGLLLGIDGVASVAHGARRHDELARVFNQGLLLAALACVPLIAVLHVAADNLHRAGVDPALVPGASASLRPLAWGLLPTLLFMAARQTLQAMQDTRAAALIAITANAVNALANYALVFGNFGAPRMGLVGSAWATAISRTFMAVLMIAWALRRGLALRPGLHAATMRELLRLGGPAAVQLFFEGGIFSLASMLMARFGPSAAAAHQVVLQIASFTFMVPLGFSVAGTVRVGNAIGREDLEGARRAGWSAVVLAAGVMVLSGATLLAGSRVILGWFHLDAETAALGRELLLCAALFQLFDGMQIALSGVLRGSGTTVASMVANLVGHWFIGLPVGCLLAFGLGMRGVGLWIGLATGLFAVAFVLLALWRRRINRIVAGEIPATPSPP